MVKVNVKVDVRLTTDEMVVELDNIGPLGRLWVLKAILEHKEDKWSECLDFIGPSNTKIFVNTVRNFLRKIDG